MPSPPVGAPPASHAWPPARVSWGWTVLLTAALACSYVDRLILTLMVDPIKADLRITDTQFGLLHGLAFVVLYSVAGLPIGALVDRYSRRVIVIGGVLTWSVMTGLCGLSSQYYQLVLARLGVGVGEATISPSAFSMLSDLFPPAQLERAMSVYIAGTGVGIGMAFALGGVTLQWVAAYGELTAPLLGPLRAWQAALLIAALPGIVLGIAALFLREPRRRGLANEPQPDWVQVARFIWRSRSVVLMYMLSVSILSVMTLGVTSWAPAYLIRTHGIGIADVGLILAFVTVIAQPCGVLLGAGVSEAIARHGVPHSAPIVLAGSMVLIVVPTIGIALAPGALLASGSILAALLLVSSAVGVMSASIQPILPGNMRGRVAALAIISQSGMGMALGSLIPALLTDNLFGGEGRMVGLSIALTIGLFAPCGVAAALFYRRGLLRFDRQAAAGRDATDQLPVIAYAAAT